MKKLLSVFLSAAMIICYASVAFAADGANPNYTLKFESNGKFKILFVADVQDVYPFKDAEVAFINEVLDRTKPDIVVFGGDNIVCSDLRAYDQLLNPLVKRGIPFTFVFGNHDDECSDLNPEQMLAVYQKYPGCLAYDADPALHGCATHNLEVKSSDGTKTAFNLWMFDSGAYANYANGTSGYDCVRKDQIDWYKAKSAELQAANGGKLVPSLAFQHIIVEEVYKAIYFRTPNLGQYSTNFNDGTSYSLVPNIFKYKGILQESPCPSLDNEGEWNAFVARGDVMGCVTGHDHVNSFVANYKGVDIIQCAGASYSAYGDTDVRGATLFTIDENKPFKYEREPITAASLAIKKGSSLPGLNGISFWDYFFANIEHKIITFFMNII